MADVFDFYVYDDRSIQFAIAEPIMLEDKDVTQFRFRIPKVLNNIDMTAWEWWFIFVNAKKIKYTTQLTLTDDEDDPGNFSVATYTVGYGFSGYVGTVSFSIEALNVSGEDIVNEWHTRTYNTHVIDTLQGTRAVIPEPGGSTGTGLTEAMKQALLLIAQKVWYVDSGGQTYYNALYNALYPPADLVSISAVYTQSGTVYDTDTLDSLRSDLVVTAHMSDQSARTVSDYTLSGTLTVGTSTITVSYGGKSTTFDVVVSEIPVLTATPSKKTIPSLNTTTGFWQTTTSSSSAAYCGFLFDESMTGGTISIDWDTDDHSILDVIVTAETDTAWSGIRTHTSKHATYGMDATVTGFSSAFYWYKFGEAYQATGSVPTVYQPTANTGTATVELPEGYKAFLVSIRRNSNSVSNNGLATDNTSFNNWAYENVTVTVRGGVMNE